MARWPSLWWPPVVVNGFESMAGVPMNSGAVQMTLLVTANLAGFIIGGGWLAMIAKGLEGEPPRWNDFKTGVNAHWLSLVTGNVVYLFLLGLVLLGLAAWGDAHYGQAALTSWIDHLQKMTPGEQQLALTPEHIPPAVRHWLMLLLAGIACWAVEAFLLLFWQPLVVLVGTRWWNGWALSIRLVFTRFGTVFRFAVLQALGLFTSLMFLAAGNGFLAVAGFMLLLVVMIYFKILYAAVVRDAYLTPRVDAKA